MSGPAITLVFADSVNPDEILDLIVALGGVRRPDEYLDGRLSRDGEHVWIYLGTPNESESETIRVQEPKLGGPIQFRAVLDLSNEGYAEVIALDLIRAMAKRWTFVIDTNLPKDPNDTVFTPTELDAYIEAGREYPFHLT